MEKAQNFFVFFKELFRFFAVLWQAGVDILPERGYNKRMNEITAITPQIKDKTRCNVFLDGRFYCGLALETAVKNRLKVGQIVDVEKLAQMQLDSEKQTAFDKALSHISATHKTEKQVRDFLSGKGYLPAVIEYVIEKMRGYQFIDDGEYAKQYASFASAK